MKLAPRPIHPLFAVVFSLYMSYNILIATLIPYDLTQHIVNTNHGLNRHHLMVKAFIAVANIISLYYLKNLQRWAFGTYSFTALFAIAYYIHEFQSQAIMHCCLIILSYSLLLVAMLVGKEHSIWKNLS